MTAFPGTWLLLCFIVQRQRSLAISVPDRSAETGPFSRERRSMTSNSVFACSNDGLRARPKPHKEDEMSIFGKIMGAIFGGNAEASSSATSATATGGTSTSTASASSSSPSAKGVDIAPILDKAVAEQKEKLQWRSSIVDLLKALKIDSSLTARKELAKELGYTGDMNDSASMNIWLHKQVMSKLAANGGKVPDDLKH
jgi:hypothetical protein